MVLKHDGFRKKYVIFFRNAEVAQFANAWRFLKLRVDGTPNRYPTRLFLVQASSLVYSKVPDMWQLAVGHSVQKL